MTIAAVAVAAMTAGDARAALGGDIKSVAADEHALSATRTVQQIASVDRHDLALPSGTLVHEYASNGVVFAITWQGPAVPALRTLLGAYFTQLESRVRHGSHHSMRFVGNDLVVRSTGHGRSHSGRAWVPSLVPSGLDIGSLE